LEKLFKRLRPQDTIVGIRYFTAEVDGPTKQNQLTYWRALGTTPLVEIIQGKFKSKQVECRNTQCTAPGRRFFLAREEKRTDVSIGVRMIDDAYQNACENMVLVSGDSDLVPAILSVRNRFPQKKIFVYVPTNPFYQRFSAELSAAANRTRHLPSNLLPISQFPAQLNDALGPIVKPANW